MTPAEMQQLVANSAERDPARVNRRVLERALPEDIEPGVTGDPFLRVLFVLREDYLAELDPYVAAVPDNLRSRQRLERLGEEAALMAIERPLVGTECRFGEGVARTLVANLMQMRVEAADETGTITVRGDYVEPVQLQVVCQSLWRALPEDVVEITESHLQAAGDVDEALRHFYEESIQRAAQESGTSEGDLRWWFESVMVTPAGTRATVYRGRTETGGIANAAMDCLERCHLIRGEWRGGARWYELTHDRFIEPIRRARVVWLTERAGAEQTRQILEARAQEWRSGGPLLNGAELLEAERWFSGPDARALGYSRVLEDLVSTSREAMSRRELERTQALVVEQQARAEAERERAQEARRRAEAEEGRAEEANRRAEAEQQRADEAQRRVTAETKRRRGLVVALIALLVVAGWAIDRSRVARREMKLSRSRELAAHSMRALLQDPELSLLLALEAVTIEATEEARAALRESYPKMHVRGVLRHKNAVRRVRVSPDGQMILTIADGAVARLWNSSTGEMVHELRGHTGMVSEAIFSPDGKRILTEAADGTGGLWATKTGTRLVTLGGLLGAAPAIAFSPDGARVATEFGGGETGKPAAARLWNAATGVVGPVLSGHLGAISAVTFSPDGRTVATGSWDKTVRLWDAGSGKPLAILRGHTKAVTDVAFAPDGMRLLTRSTDNVRLWDIRNRAKSQDRAEMVLESAPVQTTDARLFLTVPPASIEVDESSARTGRVTVWDSATGKPIAVLNRSATSSVAEFSQDGTHVVTAGADGIARLWQIPSGLLVSELRGHRSEIHTAAFDPKGAFVVTGSGDSTARIWDTANDQLMTVIPIANEAQTGGVFNVRGDLGASLRSGRIRVWDTRDGRLRHEIATSAGSGHAIALSADGNLVASASVRPSMQDLMMGRVDPTGWIGTRTCGRLVRTRLPWNWLGIARRLLTSRSVPMEGLSSLLPRCRDRSRMFGGWLACLGRNAIGGALPDQEGKEVVTSRATTISACGKLSRAHSGRPWQDTRAGFAF